MKDGKIVHKGSLEQIIKVIENRVFECMVDDKTAKSLSQQYPIINTRNEEENVFLRLVADAAPYENAIPCKPTLEDLYLYYFSEVNKDE